MKKLELSDRGEIERVVSKYPAYSDYNFVSMWSYDTDHLIEVSTLNENLVLRFQDYIDLKLFYTFLGTNQTDDTALRLLGSAQTTDMKPYLKMIPETSVKDLLENELFEVTEDRDDFDYIIRARDFVEMPGRTYHSKRKEIKKFLEQFGEKAHLEAIDISDVTIQAEIIELFCFWIETFDKNPTESEHELRAIQKLFEAADTFTLYSFGVRIDGKLVGYIIVDITHGGYAVLEFGKWDLRLRGLGEFLQHAVIRELLERGCEYINYEQDLGIEGLRRAKTLCYPAFFLKKYRISNKI